MDALISGGGGRSAVAADRRAENHIVLLGVAAAVVAGPLVVAYGRLTLAAAAAVCLFVATVARPQFAAYMLLATTPLIVGIERGALIPILRPSEAVLLLLGAAVLTRWAWGLANGVELRLSLNPMDWCLLALAVTSSAVPLLWMVGRGEAPTLDDFLYALTLWKYYGLYLLIRATVTTPAQVKTCLWLSMAAAVVVALVAVLQSLQLFGVPKLLSTYYAPFDEARVLSRSRGTSTIASSIAVADVMIFNLAIAVTLLARSARHRGTLVVLAVVFVFGALGSGQFSGAIGLLVGAITVVILTGQAQRAALAALPVLFSASLVLRSVIERRLQGFESAEGVPPSWAARLDNLGTFFWPTLFRDFNFVLGVRPAARVAAPETWRIWVFIESGHTWLLWTGGVPFLAAFLVYACVAMRATLRVARQRADEIGSAAIAAFTALLVIFVLMTFDPHLTMRGSADLAFPLLALALTASWRRRGNGAGDEPPADADRAPRSLVASSPA